MDVVDEVIATRPEGTVEKSNCIQDEPGGSMPGKGRRMIGCGNLVFSFCGKSQDEVRKLIAGPTVYICDECIDLCNDIIARRFDHDENANRLLPTSRNGPGN